MKLEGRVALITGAGSGIGAASARHMAKEGARIAVTGVPADGVEQVAEEIRTSGGEAVGIPTDVSESEQVGDAVARTVREYGRLDVAVASAGIQLHSEDRDLHTMDEAAWDRTHDVNFRGVFLTCKRSCARDNYINTKDQGHVLNDG